MNRSGTRPELTVYLRSSAPFPARERQEEAIERAERLVEDERIADLRVRRWEDRVTVRNGDETEEVATFEAFKDRVGETGHSIEPFFQEHDRGDVREIVFPVICIAVHIEEELRRVFPCRDEEGAYSVWDCLIALETKGKLADLDD